MSVCQSVAIMIPAKKLNQSRCRLGVDLGGLKEPCIRWGSRSPMWSGNFDGENVTSMANGWLKKQDQQYFYNRIWALEKCWAKCNYSCERLCWKVTKIWRTYLVINCLSVQTFRMPLAFWFLLFSLRDVASFKLWSFHNKNWVIQSKWTNSIECLFSWVRRRHVSHINMYHAVDAWHQIWQLPLHLRSSLFCTASLVRQFSTSHAQTITGILPTKSPGPGRYCELFTCF